MECAGADCGSFGGALVLCKEPPYMRRYRDTASKQIGSKRRQNYTLNVSNYAYFKDLSKES